MPVGTGGFCILNKKSTVDQGVIRDTYWDNATAFKNTEMMIPTVTPGVLPGLAVGTPLHVF